MKIGMATSIPHPLALLTNFPLIAGYVLYGINTLMLVLALRKASSRCSTRSSR